MYVSSTGALEIFFGMIGRFLFLFNLIHIVVTNNFRLKSI